MRRLYQECKLVHADLSEYNLLYYQGQVFVIDVSQSVENDHPGALDFLKRDCQNISTFFRTRGLDSAMSTKQLFEFVTDASISRKKEDQYLDNIAESNTHSTPPTVEEQISESVFLNSFIPRTLAQVRHPEEDSDTFREGHSKQVFHTTVTGLKIKTTPSKPKVIPLTPPLVSLVPPEVLEDEGLTSGEEDDE